jgi:hypothetical protein
MTYPRSICVVLIAVCAVIGLVPTCMAYICPFPFDPAPIGPVDPFPDIGEIQDPCPFPVDPAPLPDPNPFPDTGEIQDPCPFPVDPAPLPDPNPFPDTGESSAEVTAPGGGTGSQVEGSGHPDLTPQVNSSIVGCPFGPPPTPEPVIWGFPTDLSNPASAGSPPKDIDNDGKYEDVNGNGRVEFEDVILLFKDLSWCSAHQPVSPFDFDKDGKIGFHDVLDLFIEAGHQ